MAQLPKDADGTSIPAVRLKQDGAHTIAATGTTARNAVAFNAATKIISIYATDDVWLRFGTSTVEAADTDHFFPGGVYYDFSLGGNKSQRYTHVAALRVSDDCTVYISEKD